MLPLIVVCGPPCTGKTTVADGVAAKLSIPVFSVERIEYAFLRGGMDQSPTTCLGAFEAAADLASRQLLLGMSVIVDAAGTVEAQRKGCRDTAKPAHAKVIVIVVSAKAEAGTVVRRSPGCDGNLIGAGVFRRCPIGHVGC